VFAEKGKAMKLTVLVPAHNEEDMIRDCLISLMQMETPKEISEIEYVVVADRCEDKTEKIASSMGVKVLVKSFRGDYISPIAEAMAYGVENTNGELILKCDADIRAQKNALYKLLLHLTEDTGRVSSEVKTRTGKWWLDFLMWLRDINFRIAPLGENPRGAFTLFRRKVVEELKGFDKHNPTWDTAFDIRLKKAGYKVKKVKDITVLEFRRNLTLKRIINRQIEAGKSRKKLGISFIRTLLHAIFRGRIFVLYGYLIEKRDLEKCARIVKKSRI
jgi:cellulose synthase/poly-beta-1,6-N-acetylglucosamine synthase-like glycosyltransferase